MFFVKEDGTYVAGINTTDDIKEFKPKNGNHKIMHAKSRAIGQGRVFCKRWSLHASRTTAPY
jgi:hypothetical protein